MATLEKNLCEDYCNCETFDQETDKFELCKKLCLSILESLKEGYEELGNTDTEKVSKITQEIEHLKQEIINKKL